MTVIQTHIFYIGIVLVSTGLIYGISRVRSYSVSINGISKKHSFNTSIVLYIFALAAIAVPLVQRNCGIDIPNYYFSYIHDRIGGTDALFSYILKYIHRYISDPKVGYGIISGITVCVSVYSLAKAKDYLSVPVAFFAYMTCVYFYSYNYIRMLFSFSFVLLGYSSCIRGKRKLAIIPFSLAPLFHLSSIIVLVLHLALLNFKKHSKLIIALGIVVTAAFIIRPYYFLSLVAVERYQDLILNSQQSSIGLGTIIRTVPLLFILWSYRDCKNDYNYIWTTVFAFSNIAFSFLGYFVGSASRISNILLTFHVIFGIPYLIRNDESAGRRRNSIYIFVLYCMLIYAISALNFGNLGIVPYY